VEAFLQSMANAGADNANKPARDNNRSAGIPGFIGFFSGSMAVGQPAILA